MLDSVRVVSRPAPPGNAQVLVVGVFSDRKLDGRTKALDRNGAIGAACGRGECTGEVGRLAEAFPNGTGGGGKGGRGRSAAGAPRVIVVGLGKRESFTAGNLRAAAAAVGRRLGVTKEERVHVELGGALEGIKRLDMGLAGRCFGEGLGLLAWDNTAFKGKASERKERPAVTVSAGEGDGEFLEGVRLGVDLSASVNLCRSLSETPPNIATPRYIAEQTRKMARQTGLACRVVEGEALEREGCVGLINVGKASENKPCLIRIEYQPKGARGRKRPVVLVGKTMTYDTGGLSLKINNGMVGMKRDKDGGCAVIGAMHAIATVIRPDRPVVALLAVAENSISDEAYRPDDIIDYPNGVTVEVTNTDAEGRLVLADALIWACEREKPEYVVDLATLTGGVVTALGSTFAGLFCEDDALRARLEGAMKTSGERWWRLPMDQEYRDMMKSPVADILNSNPNRKAHPIQGAAFLSYFVEKDVPWAHLDIAGVHAVEGDSGPFVKGPTGWGVRLLADLVGQG